MILAFWHQEQTFSWVGETCGGIEERKGYNWSRYVQGLPAARMQKTDEFDNDDIMEDD